MNFYSCEWERATLFIDDGTHVSLVGCDFAGNLTTDPVNPDIPVIELGTFGTLTELSLIGCVFGRDGTGLVARNVVEVSKGRDHVDLIGCMDKLVTLTSVPREFWKGLTASGNVLRQVGGQMLDSAGRVPAWSARLSSQGTLTRSGDGVTTAFSFPHELAGDPSSGRGTILVSPGSVAARGGFHVDADATNITVTYAAAPPFGTNNVVLHWAAQVH